MLANVFTKSIRDRQIGMLWGVIGVLSVSVMGLAAYADLDAEVAELFSSLPDAPGAGDLCRRWRRLADRR